MKNFRPFAALVASACLSTLASAQNADLQSTVITSEGPGEMVSTDQETTITFRTNVVVTGTNMKLTCDYLQVIVVRSGDKTATIGKPDKFRSLLATGNVHIVQVDREAACGRAEVLPEQEKVILTERPVIVLHNPEFRGAGKTITMFRGERRVNIEEPVLTGPPLKDLGVDPQPKPAAPPAPETPKKP